MKDYLLYVKKYSMYSNDYLLNVYHCRTNDILHTMGEMYYRSFEHIKTIFFVVDNPSSREYIKTLGKNIFEWVDKYVGSDL